MRHYSFVCNISVLAVLLTGCSLLSAPSSEPATAILSKLPVSVPSETRHQSTLLVLQPEVNSAYNTTRMAYTVTPYQIGYFRDNQWAGTPGQMIQPLLVQTLQQTDFFKEVLGSPQSAHTSYTLHTEILELVQDYTVGPPVARLAIHLQLFDAAGQVVAGRDISEQETMREMTPYAGVTAANDALANALLEAARFITGAAR
jgi:cholesterol transport system auxiliary component